MKVYEKILEILRLHGVSDIYGVPGDALNPLTEALRKQDEMGFRHMAHEEAGAFAAGAAAKLTGRLQVCCGTVGPGALHLLNGLYDASRDHAPVLAILGQVPTEYLGSDYHQEVDLASVFDDLAVHKVDIRNPEQLPHAAINACNKAVGVGGVSVLIIPHDIAAADSPDLPVNAIRPEDCGTLQPNEMALQGLKERLEKAERPCLMVGEGAREVKDRLEALAEHLGAPIILSLRAKDLIPYESPYVAGGLGLLGSRGGVTAMQNCDLLFMLGTDFPYREWISEDADVVQVDARAESIGRRRPGALGVHAGAKPVVDWILDEIEPYSHDGALLDKVKRSKERWDWLMDRQESLDRSDDTLHPQGVARSLGRLAKEDAIFTCDTGAVTVWGARNLHTRPKQRFSLSFNHASMAYALPAAIGAQIAFPSKQVIALAGDGGFNMLMGDFLTAVRYELPIKIVIFNNRKIGLIKAEQEVDGYPEQNTDLHNPDYAALAEAMGGRGFTATEPVTLEDTLREALDWEGPAIVDALVNPDEITWPPKIKVEQAVGFGLAKVKELVATMGEED